MLTQELVAEALDACDHNQTRAREWVRAKGIRFNNSHFKALRAIPTFSLCTMTGQAQLPRLTSALQSQQPPLWTFLKLCCSLRPEQRKASATGSATYTKAGARPE